MTTDRSFEIHTDAPQSLPRKDWLTVLLVILAMVLGGITAATVGQFGTFSLLMIPAIIIVAGSFIQPDLGLLALIFVVYINLSDVLIKFNNLPSVVQPLVGLLLVVIFVRKIIYKDEFKGWTQPLILVGIYTLLSSLALFYASDFTLATITLGSFLKDVVISILIVFLIQKPSSLKRAVWVLLVAGIFMGSISIFQQLTHSYTNVYWGFGQSVLATGNYRSEGPIGDGNFYAQLIVVLIPLAVNRFFSEKSPYLRILALVAIGISTLTVIFTYSRGGFIAMAFVFALIFLRHSKRLSQVALSIAFVFIIIQFIPSGYLDRVSTLAEFLPGTQQTTSSDSFQGRTSENIVAWNMFIDHPVIGVGIGNYNSQYLNYSRALGMDPRRQNRSAHNLYLELLAERGLLGFLMFGFILYITYRNMIYAKNKLVDHDLHELADLYIALGIGLAAYLVAGLFLHDAYIRYFWLLTGLVWSAPSVANYAITKSKGLIP